MANVPSDRYTHGHHASVVGQHARRTAENDAAYLLPRLQPGMHLLDIGCGPGTITTGLARAVAPGAVNGIDVVPAVVEQARAHLAESGLTNVTFDTGSVYDLAFADGTFDVVHAHQVLQHLARPVAAAQEALRVLRPGGLGAIRDADYATMQAWPRVPELTRWLEVYHAVAARNGADCDAGRRIPSWLREAGFTNLQVSATTVLFSEPGSIQNWGYSWADRVTQSSLAEQAQEYGISTTAELQEIAAGWRAWADSPDAFFMYVNIEVVGTKPG